MKPQPRYQPGDRIGGRYQVHKSLMGGMGEVYLCLDLETNYPYALKTFQQRYLTDTQRLRRAFEHEVATWVALEKHPNIARCFYMTTLDRQPFMVLEWVASEEDRGTDLRSWLRHGPLDPQLALQVTIDLCHGLLHAQTKRPGLVHRDLKPENILMAQGGLAKLTDFGLAQIVAATELAVARESASQDGRQSLVGNQGIAGTPTYMAPEQWRGEPLDVRTDMYALGCILYELLTGKTPFPVVVPATTPNRDAVWLRTLQQAHEQALVARLPEDLPAETNDLIQRCLAKAPSARYLHVADLLNHLTHIYQAHFNQLPPPRPEPALFTGIDYTNRGATYRALGQYTQALADFARAIELDANLAQAHFNRGNTYQVLGQHAQALVNFTRAIELDPNYAGAYANRGNIYQTLGQYETALADFARAIELDPNLAQAYSNRGLTYQALGQHVKAVANFSRAIELDPKAAIAYFNRGTAYIALSQYAQARDDFDRAIELDPNYTQAYANRGNTHDVLGQHVQALADFNRAIELNPSDTQTYSNRGNIYQALGQHTQAAADYRQAIKLAPGFAPAYYNLGVTLAKQGELSKALPYLEQAVQLGFTPGVQALAQVRQMLSQPSAPQPDLTEAAFAAFLQADSAQKLQQALLRFPLLAEVDFMAAIEQVIAKEATFADRPALTQRLTWLRQIANTKNPRSPQ